MDDPFPEGLRDEWARLLRVQRPAGRDCYADIMESPCCFPLQRAGELARMIHLAREREPRVVLEIGADKGGGLYHWVAGTRAPRVAACEVRGLPYADLFEKAFPAVDFHWMPCSSRDPAALVALREWLGRDGIDCLFLDGDKAEFLADFRTYRPLLAKAGVVFVHDITDDVPGEAFHRMEGRSKQRLIDRTDWELSKRRGGDPSCAHEAWLRHWQGRSCGVGVVYL